MSTHHVSQPRAAKKSIAEESARPGTCRSKVGCEAMDEPCTNKILPAGPEGSPACLFHRNKWTSLPLSVQCFSPRMTAAGEMGLFTVGLLVLDASLSLFDHLVGKSEQPIRHLEPARLRGLEGDHQLEFGRL